MYKHYVKMVITPVGFELRSSVLTGSVTTTKIDVNTVEVEPYTSGFGTDEDVACGRDFFTASFD